MRAVQASHVGQVVAGRYGLNKVLNDTEGLLSYQNEARQKGTIVGTQSI